MRTLLSPPGEANEGVDEWPEIKIHSMMGVGPIRGGGLEGEQSLDKTCQIE